MKTKAFLLCCFALAFLSQPTGILASTRSKTKPIIKRAYLSFVSSPLRYERRKAIGEIYCNLITVEYFDAHEYYDSIFPFVVELLYDDDYWVRFMAANVIAKLDDQSGHLFIWDIYYEMQNPLENDVAEILIPALGSAGGMFASPFYSCLIPWLGSEDDNIRLSAVDSLSNLLGDLNDKPIIELLISMLNDKSPQVVKGSLAGLMKVPEKAANAEETVEGLLTSEDIEIRNLAEEFLNMLENHK